MPGAGSGAGSPAGGPPTCPRTGPRVARCRPSWTRSWPTDTLLADRDERGWDDDRDVERPPGSRGGPSEPSYPPGYEPPSYDRPPSYGQPPSYGEPDWDQDPYRRPSDPADELPQIHQPRRGDSSGRSEVVRPDEPLPPQRRPGDAPPRSGPDPADD